MKRRDFAFAGIVVSLSLVVISLILIVLIDSGIFLANPNSPVVIVLPFLLLTVLLFSLPSWEYWKKLTSIIVLIAVILFATCIHHRSESEIIDEEMSNFANLIIIPNEVKGFLYFPGEFTDDGSFKVSKEFSKKNVNKIYKLQSGPSRMIRDMKIFSFIFPWVKDNIVEIELIDATGNKVFVLKMLVKKTDSSKGFTNAINLPKYQIVKFIE